MGYSSVQCNETGYSSCQCNKIRYGSAQNIKIGYSSRLVTRGREVSASHVLR